MKRPLILLLDVLMLRIVGWHDEEAIDNAPNGHRFDWQDMLRALSAIA